MSHEFFIYLLSLSLPNELLFLTPQIEEQYPFYRDNFWRFELRVRFFMSDLNQLCQKDDFTFNFLYEQVNMFPLTAPLLEIDRKLTFFDIYRFLLSIATEIIKDKINEITLYFLVRSMLKIILLMRLDDNILSIIIQH